MFAKRAPEPAPPEPPKSASNCQNVAIITDNSEAAFVPFEASPNTTIILAGEHDRLLVEYQRL
ncbi:hypothetical protein [uncultured Marivita sp.]|uniref:hypothetical protein n=1 Tax=uncultured Marivita sp. TaxID=888080 RepID=UPI002614DEB1|nr:hypothetical protein [uncultured Marivita sp.]